MIHYDWLYGNSELKGLLRETFVKLAKSEERVTAPRMSEIRRGLEKSLQRAGKTGLKFLQIPNRRPSGIYDQAVQFALAEMENEGTISYFELQTNRGKRKVYCLMK